MDKKTLRGLVREKKRRLSPREIAKASEILGDMLRQTPVYRQARAIYGYLPYNQEVNTLPILRRALQDGKRVAVPKVYGGEMRFLWIADLAQTASGYCGIPEPIADEPLADDPTALVLTPGLAFDASGGRIGYGGGFYDKFFALEPGHPTVALCYDFQLFDTLPVERFDVPVDLVLHAGGEAHCTT